MRKIFLNSILLLCALIVGSGSLWADDETITLNFETGAIPSGWTATRFTVCANPISNTSATNGSYACKTDGTAQDHVLKYNSLIKNVKSISVDAGKTSTNTNGTMQIEFSTDGETWGSTKSVTINRNSWTNSKLTLASATDGYVRITFSGTTALKYIDNIVITYTPVAKTDPTITFNNGSVRVGKALNLSTLFESNSTGAVTYSITAGGSNASIDGSTLTGVTTGSVTVQASQEATLIHNAATATATITVTDPDLSSIAITTPPTKTTYEAGEVFDATGMVVTATFADDSEEDVTASCTWTPSGALSTSDHAVTISYTYKGVEETSSQTITVTPYTQPTSVTIDMDYNWLGSTNGGNLDQAVLPVVKSDDHVTTTITDGTSTRPRGDGDYIRVYKGSTITFAAPTGYCITSLEFTTGGNGSWTAPTVSNGFLSDTEWTGKAPSVTFYLSGSCFIASVDVALEEATAINMDITSNKWASFSSAYEVEIPTGVTAYYAQKKDAENVTLKEITGGYIPANTGVVVYSATANTYTANITTTGATLGVDNILYPWLTAGTPTAGTYYTLAVDGEKNPIFKKSSGGILAAGKAYLVMPGGSSAPSEIRIVDEENNATNIESVEAVEEGVKFIQNGQLFIKKNGVVYDVLGTAVR